MHIIQLQSCILRSYSIYKIDHCLGRCPRLVVMGGDSCSKGCGFESQHCILDGHLFVVKILMFEWKERNKRKRGRGWPIFRKDWRLFAIAEPVTKVRVLKLKRKWKSHLTKSRNIIWHNQMWEKALTIDGLLNWITLE